MGSVPSVHTTGDNDPEIYPVSYYRHYLYCDACGSFQLDFWMSDQAEASEGTRKRLGLLALVSLPSAAVVGAVARYPMTPFLFAGLAISIGLLLARAVLASKIRFLGRRCRRCRATYAFGTPFFTDLEANPRNLSVADVPRPLGSSPFERGKDIPDEPPL